MAKTDKKQHRFGLIGKDISYSFSRSYFTEKFKNLGLENYSYENFDFQEIEEFKLLIEQNTNIIGCNVTIPYKESIIPYLDELDPKAKKIGAVNTVHFNKGKLIGYNTDAYGFKKSIEPHIKEYHKRALILGTGGASKAINYVLEGLGLECTFVSRNPKKNQLNYIDLEQTILSKNLVIVNCTPLGTHPNIENKPNIPYQYITKKHLLFDLIYNPEKTAFLATGEKHGARICNGQSMLKNQAEEAWSIWNL